MSRFTVVELDGRYRIEDNEAERNTPARILDVSFTAPGEAQAHARRLNREEEPEEDGHD